MTFKPRHPRTLAAAALAAGALALLTPALPALAQVPLAQVPGAALGAEDRQFVLDASAVSTLELAASQLASDKAQSPEVRDLARRLVQDHGRTDAQLRQLADNAGMTAATAQAQGQSRDQQHHLSHLAQLPAEAFERAYVVHLLHDHSRAVADYERQARSGGNPALRAFAQQTLPALRERLRLIQEVAAERGLLDQNKLAPVQG